MSGTEEAVATAPPKRRAPRSNANGTAQVAASVAATPADVVKAVPQPRRGRAGGEVEVHAAAAVSGNSRSSNVVVVSFAEESLDAQVAQVAAKIAELQTVHEALSAEQQSRQRVKHLSDELAAATARYVDVETAARKNEAMYQEKIQNLQSRLWASEQLAESSAKQVQTLQEELRLAESRGAEMNRQVETLQVQLEARDRSLAVKEQQLQESSAMHKAMSVEGQPPPPPWGWPPGMAAMPPQTQQHQGPGTPRDHHDGPHPVFHPLFPGAAQASRMAVDGGPGGGAAPPFFAPSGPMMGPPGPGAFGHHPHHPHAMWHSPPPGSAPPQPVPPVFGDFGNNQQGGASGPEAALGMQPLGWPPQHHMPPPPLHSVVGPPPLVLQPPTPPAVSPEAAPVGERRTVVRTPMPPSSSSSTLPTDNGHAARNGDVPAPASFGETQATPQPSTGKRGGGGSRRRGGGGNAAAQAPPPSPQLMF